MNDFEKAIDDLKARLKAVSDADLARKLAIDKRTVSAWRVRGAVPERYISIINGEDHQTVNTPPLRWGPYELAAFRLALFRYTRVFAGIATSGDYTEVYRNFARQGGFWILFRRSQEDLAKAMDERTDVLDTALALLFHDDLAAGEASIERDRLIVSPIMKES